MSSSPEMSVFNLRIHKGLLDCAYCCEPLRPDMLSRITFMCAGGHIFCRECTSRHKKACISYCQLLDEIMDQMKFKCNFCDSGNTPYCRFVGHLCDPPPHPKLVEQQIASVFDLGECTLNANLLVCSECNLPLRPPIFRRRSRGGPVCSVCYCGDINNYIHYRELDYLVHGLSVKCVACEEYLPFFTLASHQLDDCPFKHKLQKIAPGSSAWKNCSDSCTDEEGTGRPTTCNSCIHWENKQKAPYEVGKMDKNIVHGDEVGNDDDSSGDSHGMSEDVFSFEDDSVETGEELEKPKTVKRVAENAFKTPPCDRKAKIAMPYGGKPAPLQPFVPRRPGTRLFQAVLNKNRDEYESSRLPAGNSVIVGKRKGTAPSKVRKMDNHVDYVVESDGGSSDDIHTEIGKRVAETALETSAYNKKAKIATPSGQKTGHTASN